MQLNNKQIFFCAAVTFHIFSSCHILPYLAPVQDQCQKGIAPDQLEPRQGLGPERCQMPSMQSFGRFVLLAFRLGLRLANDIR